MAGTQEKIQLLLRIAHQLNEALWSKYYRLMGRSEKAEMIEKAMEQ